MVLEFHDFHKRTLSDYMGRKSEFGKCGEEFQKPKQADLRIDEESGASVRYFDCTSISSFL